MTTRLYRNPAHRALAEASQHINGVVPRGEHAPLALLENLAQAGHMSLVYRYTGERQTVVAGCITDLGRKQLSNLDADTQVPATT